MTRICLRCGSSSSPSWHTEPFPPTMGRQQPYRLCSGCAARSLGLEQLGLDANTPPEEARSRFKAHFYVCECGTALLRDPHHGLPLAYALHDRHACPACQTPFPSAEDVASISRGFDHPIAYTVWAPPFVGLDTRRLGDFVRLHASVRSFVSWVCRWDERLTIVSDAHPSWTVHAQRLLAREFSPSVQIGSPSAQFDTIPVARLSERIDIRADSLATVEAITGLRVLVAVARADGRMDDRELALLRQLGDRHGIAREQLDEMFSQERPAIGRSDLPQNDRDKECLMDDVLRLSAADERIDEAELRIVRRLGQALGLSDDSVEKAIEQASGALDLRAETDPGPDASAEDAEALVRALRSPSGEGILAAAQRIKAHLAPSGAGWNPADPTGRAAFEVLRPVRVAGVGEDEAPERLETPEWHALMLAVDQLNPYRSTYADALARGGARWAFPLLATLAQDAATPESVRRACRSAAEALEG